jgi:hypothetical protein
LSQFVGEDESVLLYPNQLKVVDNGMLSAVVKLTLKAGILDVPF